MVLNYLRNPNEAVEKIKDEVMLEKSIGVMALSAFLFSINTLIALDLLEKMGLEVTGPQVVSKILSLGTLDLAVAMFFGIFLGGLFFGWIMNLIMNLLGGEGGYFEGLTTIAYPVLAASVGILIAMLVSYVPVVGSVLSFIVVAIFFAIGYASMYRFAKELFDTGMIEAFVGVSVLFAIFTVAVYGGLATSASGLQAILPNP